MGWKHYQQSPAEHGKFLADFFTAFAALVDDFVFAGTFFEEAFGFDFVFFAVAIN